MIIVPEVEAFVPKNDIGFEQPGQEVQSAAGLPASVPILVVASPWALRVGSSTSRLHHPAQFPQAPRRHLRPVGQQDFGSRCLGPVLSLLRITFNRE
jgi:hypothetical protein